MNKIFVHDITKAERGNASLFAISDWSNKIMNTVYIHDIMKGRPGADYEGQITPYTGGSQRYL